MDSLVQTVLSGNIFIQTQSFQKVIELCSGSGSNQVCSACCLVRSSMNQYWKAAAPEPVYGQRQCRVGRVLGDQRCDTPDQSAARSTTLGHLLSKGVTKGKGGSRKTAQQTKERGEWGRCWKSWTSLRPERPGTTPEGNEEPGEAREKGERKGSPKTEPKQTGGAKEQGPKIRKKGDAPPTDVRRKTRTKKGQNRSELKWSRLKQRSANDK